MILWELFASFFKIGLFTIGGGYAMLPLIQQTVMEKGWLDISKIIDFIAVSESTPGPFAVNMATFIGSDRGVFEYGSVFFGIVGAAVATLGVILPSFIIILIVAHCYEQFKKNKYVKGAMTGLKPVVIGLIASAVLSMINTVFFTHGVTFNVFKTAEFYISAVLFLSMAYLAIKKKTHPIIIILISAVVGILAGCILKL